MVFFRGCGSCAIHAVPSSHDGVSEVSESERPPFSLRVSLHQIRNASHRGGAGAKEVSLNDDVRILIKHVRDAWRVARRFPARQAKRASS